MSLKKFLLIPFCFAIVFSTALKETNADIVEAGTLLVDLDARDASAGSVEWINNGFLDSFAEVQGDAILDLFGTTDQPGVSFDGNTVYQGEIAPGGITGGNDRSIEVWAFNPDIGGHETMVSWGHRGGPGGSNLSFTYGNNGTHGAVGHWGGPDMGWNGAPDAGQWHHLVYTFDGTTTNVYADGVLKNSEATGLNTHSGTTINLGMQHVDASNSNFFAGEAFSGVIGAVRIHDGVLSPDDILTNLNNDAARFGVTTPEPPEPPPAPELVSLWQFNDSGNIGRDTGIVGNQLDPQGDAAFDANGKQGGSLALDGDGDMLTSAAFPDDVPTGEQGYTMAAWIKPDATGAQGIIGWGNYGSGRQVNALRTNGDNGLVHYWWGADLSASDAQVAGAGADLDDGQWHHIVATFDGTDRILYVDGQEVSSDSPGLPGTGAANFAIGRTCDFCGDGEFFSGNLDDVAVFTGALSPAQVQDVMGGDYSKFGGPVPEPTTWALAMIGFLGLLIYRFGKRRALR